MVDTGTEKILLDCGTFMEKELERRNSWFPFDPSTITAVALTHAHMDHVGRIPLLFKKGFSGTVICARPTKELSHIMLDIQLDMAGDLGHSVSYTSADLQRSLSSMYEFNYGDPFRLSSGTEIELMSAAHILGSSMILVRFGQGEQRRTLLFTGDLQNAGNAILKPRNRFPEIDYLVIESTYGAKVRTTYDAEREQFFQLLRETAEDGGVMLIPAYVLARTQKMIGMIYLGMREGKVPSNLNIYIDSPSSSKITQIYARFPEQMAEPFQGILTGGQSPFTMDTLHLYKTFDEIKLPAVIIAPSSDMSKGKIVEYVKQDIDRPTTKICFVSSYFEPGSIGEKLAKGATEIEINSRFLSVRAKTFVLGSFSGHGDRAQIEAWLRNFKPIKRVFVVHGSPGGTCGLADHITKTFGWPTVVAELDCSYDLEMGKKIFIPKEAPKPLSFPFPD